MSRELSPNSAVYWLNRIQSALSTWVPKSIIVPYDHQRVVDVMEGAGKYPEWPSVIDAVHNAAAEIGYPVFIRTDLASAKHDGPRAYKANNASEINKILCRTVEDNELKLWMNPEQPQAFVVRQFLELDSLFNAFGGLPIAREWRLFVSTELLCAHPYWPEDAIDFYVDEPIEWRQGLAELHEPPPEREWLELVRQALTAVSLCDKAEAWSVDFARDKSGKWWLIDMAVAEQSWHWPDCVNAKRRVAA